MTFYIKTAIIKTYMKKIAIIFLLLVIGIGSTILIDGCAATKTVIAKSGSQLWGENCIRCHNAPSSAEYSGVQWETIGMHMMLRANLTDDETNKIVAFLKSAN
jgi:hypothetical protein